MRKLRKFLTGPVAAGGNVFLRQRASFLAAQTWIRACYVLLLFVVVSLLREWPGMAARGPMDPLWPLRWVPAENTGAWIYGILGFQLFSCLLAALLPGLRLGRVLAFLGMFFAVALNNSYGKIGHSQHLWVLLSLMLIFLPKGWNGVAGRMVRQKTLLVFWGCQALVLLTYSMSGLGKISAGIYQVLMGQMSLLSPQAMSVHIADRLLQTNSVSHWGGWLIERPWLGWPMLLGAVYIQFFSFVIAFRPVLQKWWALGLILFHIGSYFVLTITFPHSIAVLALLFFHSPFAPASASLCSMVRALPVAGDALVFWKREKRPPCGC